MLDSDVRYKNLNDAEAAIEPNQVIAVVADGDEMWFVPADAADAKIVSGGAVIAILGGELSSCDPESEDAFEDTEEEESDGPIGKDRLAESRVKVAAEKAAALSEFNAKYMVVNDGGSPMIFSDIRDDILGRQIYQRMRPGTLNILYENRRICTSVNTDGARSYQPIASFWRANKKRRQYIAGVTFDPSTTESRDGFLNLWRGFGFTPKVGSWAKLKSHIRENLCCSNQEYFDYLMSWMARLVQHPGEQGEVAIVLRGNLGNGKGIFGHTLRKLFGQHGMHINNPKHLVGNFNAHLRDCIFLFADEAFFAGDKAAVGTLKSIITESTITIEGKGQDVIQCKNMLHVLMSSNNEWVVPSATDERRFFVLDVSDAHKQDHAYFDAIAAELASGGYEAMLYDLLIRDIREFNVRRVPKTAALQDQKMRSLSTDLAWWLDVLHRGYVYQSKLGLEEYFGEWHEWMATDVLFASYENYARSHNERHPMSRETFGKFMIKMGGALSRPSSGIGGERVLDTIGDRRSELVEKVRPPGYRLGSLIQARAAFEVHTSITQDWGEDPMGEE